jgi:hypothetical protein
MISKTKYEKINLSDVRIKQFVPEINAINTYYGKIRIFVNLPVIEGKEFMYFKDLIHNNNICLKNGRFMVKIRKSKVFGTLNETWTSYGKVSGIYHKSIEKDLKSQEQKFAYFRKIFISEKNFNQENHHPNGHMDTEVILLSKTHHKKIHGGI